MNYLECNCQSHEPDADFYFLRDSCAALRELIIPNKILDRHRNFCIGERDEAQNQSIAYLAHQRGDLKELTYLIHMFLMSGFEAHPRLSRQYKEDIKEDWIFGKNTSDRYRRCQAQKGRLYELAFYSYLENSGWEINSTEALGSMHDVVATSKEHEEVKFEFKSICHDKSLAQLEVQALQNYGVSYGAISVYSPLDYLLHRVYEAAKQLNDVNGKKVVAIAFEDYETNYKIPLSEEWIDWREPKFFERDNDIFEFLSKERGKNKNLDMDLRKVISEIEEIWFLRRNSAFGLERVHVISNPK